MFKKNIIKSKTCFDKNCPLQKQFLFSMKFFLLKKNFWTFLMQKRFLFPKFILTEKRSLLTKFFFATKTVFLSKTFFDTKTYFYCKNNSFYYKKQNF